MELLIFGAICAAASATTALLLKEVLRRPDQKEVLLSEGFAHVSRRAEFRNARRGELAFGDVPWPSGEQVEVIDTYQRPDAARRGLRRRRALTGRY
jgi:hypothetical protein